MPNEDPVFEAIVTWIKYDMGFRKDKFQSFLHGVQLSHCSIKYLKNTVGNEPLMQTLDSYKV